MVVGVLGIAVIAVVSAIIGGAAVYLHSQNQEDTNGGLWSAITVVGFIIGVIPGVIAISAYLLYTRK